MGSARPLTAKKEAGGPGQEEGNQSFHQPSSSLKMNSAGGGMNVPARKIGPEQFYKPPAANSLTPS